MAFDFMLGQINELVDWGLAAVSLMIAYYVVKIFLVGGPDSEARKAAEEARQKKFKGFISKKKRESDEKKEKLEGEKKKKKEADELKKKKKELKSKLEPITGFLIKCLNETQAGYSNLNSYKASGAANLVKIASKDLGKVVREGKHAWRELQGEVKEWEGDVGDKIGTYASAAQASWLKTKEIVRLVVDEKKKREDELAGRVPQVRMAAIFSREVNRLLQAINGLRTEYAALLQKVKLLYR